MEIIDVIAQSFDRVLNAALRLFLGMMNFIETGLRGPLQAIGIHGALQTLVLMMIPLLMIVAAAKLFAGLVRGLLVVVLVLVLIHVSWPVLSGSSMATG